MDKVIAFSEIIMETYPFLGHEFVWPRKIREWGLKIISFLQFTDQFVNDIDSSNIVGNCLFWYTNVKYYNYFGKFYEIILILLNFVFIKLKNNFQKNEAFEMYKIKIAIFGWKVWNIILKVVTNNTRDRNCRNL